MLHVRVAVGVRQQDLDRRADQLLPPVPERPLGGRVHQRDPAVPPGGDDAFRGGFEEPPHRRLGPAQRLFGDSGRFPEGRLGLRVLDRRGFEFGHPPSEGGQLGDQFCPGLVLVFHRLSRAQERFWLRW
jgi:hypothetical protein